MGRRGPRPLTDEERKRRGTFQPSRSAAARAARAARAVRQAQEAAAPADPARVRVEPPPPPRHLKGAARRIWIETAAEAADDGLTGDVHVLELYATALAALRADPAGRSAPRWASLADRLRRDLSKEAATAPATDDTGAPAAPPAAPPPEPEDPVTCVLVRGKPIPATVSTAFLFGARRLLHPLPALAPRPDAAPPPPAPAAPLAEEPGASAPQAHGNGLCAGDRSRPGARPRPPTTDPQ